MMYDILPEQVQVAVKACKMDLAQPQARCETAYGKDSCEQISPAAFQTKCKPFFERQGCCHCTMVCPEGYTEDDYHCIKPASLSTPLFATEAQCTQGGKSCERVGTKYAEACPANHERTAQSTCTAICPFGWHDEGKRCRKPADYRMAQPFFWEKGDN